MDPIGGIRPSAPRLDSTPQVPPQPAQFTVDQPPQFVDQPVSSGSIPQEVLAEPPVFQEALPPQPPQFIDPMAGYQQPMDPDPMLSQPMADPSMPAPSGGKKPLLIIIGAVVALALLGGVGFAGYTMGKQQGRKQTLAEFQQQQVENDDTVDDTTSDEDAMLTLGELADLKPEEEEQTGEIKQQMTASDGFVVKVTDVERNFTPDVEDYELDKDKELIKVNFVMGNQTKDRAKDIASDDLRLEESDGTKITPESRLSSYPGKFTTIKLEPGVQEKASIVFAVKKDSAPLSFVREQPYRLIQGGAEKVVTTRIVITIVK